MTKLTDTQLVLLSAAAQREDRIIPIGERLKGGVAKSVGAKLISLGLAEDRIVAEASLSWRTDENSQHVALVITKQGLDAIGVESESGEPVTAPASPAASTSVSEARSGTKQATIINLLKREEGASLDDLIAATGCSRTQPARR